jgi:hypothetical protein
MKKRKTAVGLVIGLLWGAAGNLKASPEGEAADAFKPYWRWQILYSNTRQQAGQNINALSFSGSFYLSQAGDYLSASLDTSNLKIEGANSFTGGLGLSGGLGLGSFTPSLSLSFSAGSSAYRSVSGSLSLGIQLWDPFSISFFGGASTGSHQGDAAQFFALPANVNPSVIIDTKGWNAGLGLNFLPWDWLSLSWSVQNSYDVTYRIENLARTASIAIDQSDRILSFNLGADFILDRTWALGLFSQAGQEYYPAGSVYSPLAGGVVEFSAPYTQNFLSGGFSVSFSFE